MPEWVVSLRACRQSMVLLARPEPRTNTDENSSLDRRGVLFHRHQRSGTTLPQSASPPPAAVSITNSDSFLIRWQDADPDGNAAISLYYDTDDRGFDGVLIVSGHPGGPGRFRRQLRLGHLRSGRHLLHPCGNKRRQQPRERICAGHLRGGPDGSRLFRPLPPQANTIPNSRWRFPARRARGHLFHHRRGTRAVRWNRNCTGLHPFRSPKRLVIKFMAVDQAGNQSPTAHRRIYHNVSECSASRRRRSGPPNPRRKNRPSRRLGAAATRTTVRRHSPFPGLITDTPGESGLTDASILRADTSAPEFTPDTPGLYELRLTVDDGEDRATDRVQVVCEAAAAGDLDAGRRRDDGIDRNILLSAMWKCSGHDGYVAEADLGQGRLRQTGGLPAVGRCGSART